MRPQPPPPTFFCKDMIPGQLFLRLYKDVILRDLVFAGFRKRFSAECADSKRVFRLTMRPGRWSLRKLFWRSYKSFILKELFCAVAKGWASEEAPHRILERRDSKRVANGCLRVRELGTREQSRARIRRREGRGLFVCISAAHQFRACSIYFTARVKKDCGNVGAKGHDDAGRMIALPQE